MANRSTRRMECHYIIKYSIEGLPQATHPITTACFMLFRSRPFMSLKHLHVFRNYEHCLILHELKIPKPLLRHLNVNGSTPFGSRFHLHQRTRGVDVLDPRTEVATTIGLSINLQQVRTHINDGVFVAGMGLSDRLP